MKTAIEVRSGGSILYTALSVPHVQVNCELGWYTLATVWHARAFLEVRRITEWATPGAIAALADFLGGIPLLPSLDALFAHIRDFPVDPVTLSQKVMGIHWPRVSTHVEGLRAFEDPVQEGTLTPNQGIRLCKRLLVLDMPTHEGVPQYERMTFLFEARHPCTPAK